MSKTFPSALRLAVLTSLAFGLTTGCDQSPSGSSQPATVSSQPATATPVAPPPPPPQTYPATLAEGIDFARPGYPDFIAEVSGLSGHEDWGRWSEGDKTIFRFKQPLSGKFTLSVTAHPFGPNMGQPIKVSIGSVQQEFALSDGEQTISLGFALPTPADQIEFQIPQPTSPQELKMSEDPRKLGIGFLKLQIAP